MPAIATATSTPITTLLDFEIITLEKKLESACWMPEELDITLAKLDVIDRSGAVQQAPKALYKKEDVFGIKQPNEKDPISYGALKAREKLDAALGKWAAKVAVFHNLTSRPTEDSTDAIADWMVGVDGAYLISQMPTCREAYFEIVEAVAAAERIVDLPEVQEPTLDNLIRTIANIRTEVLDAYATAPSLVTAMKVHGITNMNADRIHRWRTSKGLKAIVSLEEKTRYNGEWLETVEVEVPTFRLRDVCDLWLEAELKKQATFLKKQATEARKAARLAAKSEMAMAA
jgi:hypothetical protein